MASGASILSGFLKGIAQKKQKSQEEERRKPLDALNLTKTKLETENLKLKQQQMKFRQSILEMLAPKIMGGASRGQEAEQPSKPQPKQETKFSPNFQLDVDDYDLGKQYDVEGGGASSGVSSMIAQGQMPTEILQVLSLLKEDYSGAGQLGLGKERLSETIKNNLRLKAQGEERIRSSNLVPVKAKDKYNNEVTYWVDKRTAGQIQTGEAPALSLSDLQKLSTASGSPVQPGGQTLQDISGLRFKKEKQSIETAAKSQGMRAAISGIDKVIGMITNPDGTIDKSKIFQLKPLPLINSPMPDFIAKAFSKDPPIGQQMHTLVAQGYESLIRGESGAAVPEEELTRLAKRYGIDWTMDEKTIKMRLFQLQTILQGTVQAIDPDDRHKYSAERISKREYPGGRLEYVLLPDKYEMGQVYTNAEGESATYLGEGKWEVK